MVGRHEEIARVVVVDLDGTLLRFNSFRAYAGLGLRYLLKQRRFRAFSKLVFATVLRKAGVISHNRYREKCVAGVGFPRQVLDGLRVLAGEASSQCVWNFIREKQGEGYAVLLATAALSDYVGVLWNGGYVATELKDGKISCDCRGEAKLRRVLDETGGRVPAYVLSDSSADFPLLRHAARNGGKAVLVNPDKRTLRFFRELEPAELFDVEFLLD